MIGDKIGLLGIPSDLGKDKLLVLDSGVLGNRNELKFLIENKTEAKRKNEFVSRKWEERKIFSSQNLQDHSCFICCEAFLFVSYI